MHKRFAIPALACLLVLSLVSSSRIVPLTNAENSRLSTKESQITALVNGTNVYDYDLGLEQIGLDHNLSAYSFRSAGSTGANATANWIKEQFEDVGLADTHMESFEFTNWNLMSQPLLVTDEDGNESSTNDQAAMPSFQSEHYSWPTPEEGVFGEVVTLPLPYAVNRRSVGGGHYDAAKWSTTNITGKILLIGREVRWDTHLALIFTNKIAEQPPLAIIFTWSYDWMSWAPPSFNSVGGRPASSIGPYFWDSKIPVGWTDYQDGLWMRQKADNAKLYARVTINAEIGSGPHYNVIGKLPGSVNPEKIIIISGHYDTVMDSGFCDNGAGTAGVIELARVFSVAAREDLYKPEYTLVFIAFTGEELGLVGAANYVKQHESQLQNIVAVINLDCIGGNTLEISETFVDDNGLNLEDIVRRASGDLNVQVRVTEPGGSDQEAFRNPLATDSLCYMFWESRPGIVNMTRVKSSIMLGSYPLFISDIWDNGTAGWIHTSYDNSTSSQTLNWIDAVHLQSHVQVAALTVMRVISVCLDPFLTEVYSITAVSAAVVGVAIFFKRSRVSKLMKKVSHDILSYLGLKELVYIIMLTAFLLFMSYFLFMRVDRIELIIQGYPTPVDIRFFGAPLHFFGVVSSTSSASESGESALDWTQSYQGSMIMQWQGLLLDTVFYAVLAFFVTYAVARTRTRLEYSKHVED